MLSAAARMRQAAPLTSTTGLVQIEYGSACLLHPLGETHCKGCTKVLILHSLCHEVSKIGMASYTLVQNGACDPCRPFIS